MSTIVKDLGVVTAYAYAVAGGYTGTEEEFIAMLGEISVRVEELESLSATATTLEPGEPATASYDDGVITIGVPKGAKGQTGPQGPTGPEGPTGPSGQDGQDGQNGQDGQDGTTFTPSVSSAGVISWTNDGGKTNPQSVDLVAAAENVNVIEVSGTTPTITAIANARYMCGEVSTISFTPPASGTQPPTRPVPAPRHSGGHFYEREHRRSADAAEHG